MSEPLDQTQALPTEEPTAPASPPVTKPTLASLIVDRIEGLQLGNAATHDRVSDLYVLVTQVLEQIKTLLLVAIASLLLLSVAVLACLVFEAILVGHVR